MPQVEPFAIRRALAADLQGLVQCDPYALAHAERCEYLATAVEQKQCLAAFAGSRALGFLVLTYGFFERGFISLVVVAPSTRRKGIAQRLLAAAESECRTEALFTSTNSSNVEAQRLFERAGFFASGRIENLDPGDTELIYFKRCAGARNEL